MLDYARVARRLSNGRERADLDSDEGLRLALTRAIEVIGEAAAKVTDAGRQQYPGVEWRSIVATRHRLIHGYDAVDLNLLWSIVQDDLPSLISQLEESTTEGD
jgi:uncharacterized protein with HEPN domain